jgi:hypothetical protein
MKRKAGTQRRWILIKGFGNRPPKHISGVATGQEARFQRLGPTA